MSEPTEAPKPSSWPNVLVRLATAVVFIPVLLLFLYGTPKWVFLAFCGLIAVPVAAGEMAGMTLPGRRIQQAWALLASLAVYAAVFFQPSAKVVAAALVGVVTGGFVFGLIKPAPLATAGSRMAWLVVTPLYAGGLIAALPLLHRLERGGSWVVLAMTLAWLGDTAAYFAGKAFGRRKLYEAISPKKTVAGAVGGLAGSVAGAVVMSVAVLPDLPLLHAVPLAAVAAIAGQAGDLTISLIKRSAEVKDSGWIVPGHGGLLDRIDGLVMTSAITWAYTAVVLDGW